MTKIIVDVQELSRAIKAVIPVAAKPKDNLPILECVHLVKGGDDALWLEATDRYRIARAGVRAAIQPGDTFDALIRAESLKLLLPQLKGKRGDYELAHDESSGTVRLDDPVVSVPVWLSQTEEGSFPKLEGIISETLGHAKRAEDADTSRACVYLNPILLSEMITGLKAASGVAAVRADGITIHDAAGKLLVAHGSWFIGVLMPMRMKGDDSATGRLEAVSHLTL